MFSIATIPWSSTLSPSSDPTHLAKGCILAPSPGHRNVHRGWRYCPFHGTRHWTVGQVFRAFARFPLTDATSQDNFALCHNVGITAIELVALAVGASALGSVTSALWIATGERNVMSLRKKVHEAVTTREMECFGTKMGAEDSVITTEGYGPVGAGGLMAKFAK